MSTLKEITAELKMKGLTKHAEEIEKVIADSDDIIKIYFYLVFEEDNYEEDKSTEDVGELENKVYKKAQELFKPFGNVNNEGHDSDDDLICYFRVKKSDLPKLQELINRKHEGGDDQIDISEYFIARGFIFGEPGEEIPFEDWDAYIEDMESRE